MLSDKIPSRIARLEELAYNFWWSWHREARDLFKMFDYTLWRSTSHNPVQMLLEVSSERLEELAADPLFLRQYDAVLMALDTDLKNGHLWFPTKYPNLTERPVAYFSAEFGLHQSLPIYSGGLGVLAGDHCKEASDIGLPLVAVGFLYEMGYFRQCLTADGWQEAVYPRFNPEEAAIREVRDEAGKSVFIPVEVGDRAVHLQIWHAQAGRTPFYLMDADNDMNAPWDRELTARLYGGDQEMRIQQEIVLGIGGMRTLRALGVAPAVFHLNEGHSAFLAIEQIRRLMTRRGLDLAQACTTAHARNIFTTHTPVPAGNDAFDRDHVREYLRPHAEEMGIDVDELVGLGLMDPADPREQFGMTVLALRLARFANGVSELHGAVARDMWQFLWPDSETHEVPIEHVTNGVHLSTWIADEMDPLYRKHLADEPASLPRDVFWAEHERRRGHLVQMVRERLIRQGRREGASAEYKASVAHALDPHALTIGFARRFAPYKRATLMLRDPGRLARILGAAGRPVQIIIAGKAHPRNEPGKELMKHVWEMSRRPEFQGRLVLVEGYDIDLARHLVQGCDVWLNTPRRPMEASGTSGMKAAANGALNLSVLDGWWCEGYEENNGWAIGTGKDHDDPERQDAEDAESFYSLLEEQIAPLFYERDDGLPGEWVRRMIEAVEAVIPQFSTARMVDEYADRFYVPCATEDGPDGAGDQSSSPGTMSRSS